MAIVVARVDELDRDSLRDLALAVRDMPGVRAVVLGGAPEGGGVALVSAVADDAFNASELIADAAKTVKGGGGKSPDLAIAGGKDPAVARRRARPGAGRGGHPTDGPGSDPFVRAPR